MWAILQSLKAERKKQRWEDSFWNSGMFSRETACRRCFLGLVENLPLKKVHLEQEPPAVFETKSISPILIFTLVKTGVEGAADGTVSNCIPGTKLDCVQFCMLGVSLRGHWAESLMVHNPDFTV